MKFRGVMIALIVLLIGCAAFAQTPESFTFSGGTGKVQITCPSITESDGQTIAKIVFSSSKYEYVKVNGETYYGTHTDGTSEFEIPCVTDRDMELIGMTSAMSTPHEVTYTIRIGTGAEVEALPGLKYERSMALRYAHEFSVDYYEGGYKLITVSGETRYLVVPENADIPEGIDGDIRIIPQPLNNVYLAASSAMALFNAVGGIDTIGLSGTQASGWYIEAAVQAMNEGRILYAGKYSEPDYELLVKSDCPLAIESTMILHSPKVQEMLELLGITVFIDRSSYETHPLGRTEWVKLYAAMINKEDEADAFFDRQAQVIDELKDQPSTGKTVAFFYVSSDGSVVVRGSDDYIAGMIGIAGGEYIFKDLTNSDSNHSSVTITMEQFYAASVDADYLIYNAAIDSPLTSIEELIAKDGLFADFAAVQNGNVWCTEKSLYQATDIVGNLITDIRHMICDDGGEMQFLHRLV